MLRSRGILNAGCSGVLSTELSVSLSSLGAFRSCISWRFTISSDEIAGGPPPPPAAVDGDDVGVLVVADFLNEDVPKDGGLGLVPTRLACSEVGEGTLSLSLSEPSRLGILGGTFKSFGLSIVPDIFGDGDNSPGIEVFASPSVLSVSLSSV